MSVQAPERVAPPVEAALDVVIAPASTLRPCVAAMLSASAAAWMAGGLFQGFAARAVGVFGAALGAVMVAVSYRTRRPSFVQYLVLPVAAVVGAVLALPDANGADLTSLIGEALRGGGLAQPPLPFDPGWRFLLVLLTAVLGAAAASTAIASGRGKLAVALPAPVVLGGALLAPPGSEVTASAVAIALVLAALAVSFGSELVTDASTSSAGFERKRLVRGAAALVALAVAMIALGQARFLFPATTKERVVPAQRPTAQQVLADRVLFTVRAKDPGPWRLGVLDSYDGRAWLLPSYDPARLRDVPADGSLADPLFTFRTDRPSVSTTFTAVALDGRTIPVTSGAVSISGLRDRAQFDPLTQSLRLPEARLRAGVAYTVTSIASPSGRELSSAAEAPAWAQTYRIAPEPPNEVVTLLRKAPRNAWDRLQFVRAALYRKVIAAGAGHPAEVPPERVVAMLRGAEATPYEITAAEALLARWAGVPARIGYGFYAGDRVTSGAPVASVRPRHGATWVEVYFEGYGWVSVVGVPPRARSSLSGDPQNQNPNVRPSDELALVVHIPIRLQSVRLAYLAVRYWLGVVLGFVAGALALWFLVPGALKTIRRTRRTRWARANGVRARIAVAYAEMRDAAADLGALEPAASPLRFVAAVAHDDEHAELAWLVTRALWGDLARDLTEQDAVAAEAMARSVRLRISRAQPALSRVVGFCARTSLRDPYASDVPNLWPAWLAGGLRARRRSRRLRRASRKALAATLLCVGLVACGAGNTGAQRQHTLPARIAPPQLGDVTFKREPKAERAYLTVGPASLVQPGRVYTLRQGATIQASLQVAAFKTGIDALDDDVRDGVLRSIGGGRFALRRLGDERVYVRDRAEQTLLLWFTPDGGTMVLLDARRAFTGAQEAFLGVLRYIQGKDAARTGPPPVLYDPVRGTEP